MITLIQFEIKNLFKQKKTSIIILILLLLGFFLVNDYRSKAIDYEKYTLINIQSQILRTKREISSVHTLNERAADYENQVDSLNLLLESLIRKEKAYLNQNWNNYYKEEVFYNYWYVSEYSYYLNQIGHQSKIDEHYEMIEMQQMIGENLGFTELDFSTFFSNQDAGIQIYKQSMLLNYHLWMNNADYPPPNRYTMNGSLFIYHIFDNFSIVFFVLLIIMHYSTMSDERKNGGLKLLFSMPYKRSFFLVGKFMAALLSSLIIMLLPLMIISVLLHALDGISMLDYLVLSHSRAWTSIIGIENNLSQDVLQHGGNFTLGVSKYSSFPAGRANIHPALELIPLGQFYGRMLLLIVLNYSFVIILTNLISLILRNKFVALTTSLLLFGLGIFLSDLMQNTIWATINPFSAVNVLAINGATSSVTLLSALCVLITFFTVILIINNIIYKTTSI